MTSDHYFTLTANSWVSKMFRDGVTCDFHATIDLYGNSVMMVHHLEHDQISRTGELLLARLTTLLLYMRLHILWPSLLQLYRSLLYQADTTHNYSL